MSGNAFSFENKKYSDHDLIEAEFRTRRPSFPVPNPRLWARTQFVHILKYPCTNFLFRFVISWLENDEAHFWLNGYVNKQNCRIWSEANPQVYVERPLHPEKLTVWCALWAGGILLQKR
ncbi:putative transposase [Trichonephila clavipes]|nr:putative transposase [Trichonephila clavipes]